MNRAVSPERDSTPVAHTGADAKLTITTTDPTAEEGAIRGPV